jgi:hypothetical protein
MLSLLREWIDLDVMDPFIEGYRGEQRFLLSFQALCAEEGFD